MFKNVLVIAEGDDPNQPALRRALACLAVAGELEVFDAVYEPMLEGYLGNKKIYEPLRKRVVNERQERADALARAVESPGVRARGHAVWAHPLAQAVADEVAARGSDLVVVAAGGPLPSDSAPARGLSHGLWQLVTTCRIPVLVVKNAGPARYRSIVAAVDPFHSHAKPAALDNEILRHAKVLHAQLGAALTVLHCYAPLDYFGDDLSQLPAHDSRFVGGRQEALEALCREADLSPAAARLVAGAPHLVLQGLQQSGAADLVVMGALARGRFAEFILGSTAERVLHHGGGDVLVVNAPSRPPSRDAARAQRSES